MIVLLLLVILKQLQFHVIHGVPQLLCSLQGALDVLLVQESSDSGHPRTFTIFRNVSIWTCGHHLVFNLPYKD